MDEFAAVEDPETAFLGPLLMNYQLSFAYCKGFFFISPEFIFKLSFCSLLIPYYPQPFEGRVCCQHTHCQCLFPQTMLVYAFIMCVKLTIDDSNILSKEFAVKISL